jgi:hypothetical protein
MGHGFVRDYFRFDRSSSIVDKEVAPDNKFRSIKDYPQDIRKAFLAGKFNHFVFSPDLAKCAKYVLTKTAYRNYLKEFKKIPNTSECGVRFTQRGEVAPEHKTRLTAHKKVAKLFHKYFLVEKNRNKRWRLS